MWKIPLENPWKWHFVDSYVPRCFSPQEFVLLVRVPKLATIHYLPATKKLFDSPAFDPEKVGRYNNNYLSSALVPKK